MSLKRIGIIFRKELLDTLRDRKTLIFMVALPVLLMPGLMTIMTRVTQREVRKTRESRLVVQVEADERARFCEFLRGRLKGQRDNTETVLQLWGPEVSEPARAIAADLGIDAFEVLIGVSSDPRVQAHAKTPSLRAAVAAQQQAALKKAREMLDAAGERDENGAASPAVDKGQLRFLDLIAPLVTFDFVTADEARTRPVQQSAPPENTFPAKVRADAARCAAATAITQRRIQALLRVPLALDASVPQRNDTVAVEVVYDSTIDLSAEAERRIEAAVAAARDLTTTERLAREDLPASFVAPVRAEPLDAAPRSKQVMKFVASILPYILILMCFLGGLYPATDLGAGEKERLTLETLLVAPASRLEIALGKFGVVFLSALVASVLATASMGYTFASGIASKELSQLFELKLDVPTTVLCLALIAPLAATFASLMLAMSIYAKTQKEAQSLMMPLQFLIIIPAMLSTIPTIELDLRTAWVPVMNVALGLRAILTAGGAPLPWPEIAIIFLSTSLFALLALLFCAKRFNQESVIFRS